MILAVTVEHGSLTAKRRPQDMGVVHVPPAAYSLHAGTRSLRGSTGTVDGWALAALTRGESA
jgi:hypothetical protein